jgi:hypothetical protein
MSETERKAAAFDWLAEMGTLHIRYGGQSADMAKFERGYWIETEDGDSIADGVYETALEAVEMAKLVYQETADVE